MRRATQSAEQARHREPISIHALHEESDVLGNHDVFGNKISIHALHEESDRPVPALCDGSGAISIHALHEESD